MNNMKNKILSLLVLLLTAATGAWAEEVTIGDPTSTSSDSYLPSYSRFEYSFTQQIYTADEIGMSGTITTLTMWLKNTSSYARNINVYMKEVSGSIFETNISWVSLSADDLVGTATINNGVFDPTETTLTLETPFEYSGTGNLLICIHDITGKWSSGMSGVFFYETGRNQSLYAYRDGVAYDISNPGVQGYLNNIKNVVRLEIEESVDVTTNAEEGETTFTKATFLMPTFDATAEYVIVRNMGSEDVTVQVGDGTVDQPRFRVRKKEQGEGYEAVDYTSLEQIAALISVYDAVEEKALTPQQDFYVKIFKIDEQTGQPLSADGVELADFDFAPGLYAVKAIAQDDSEDYGGETGFSNLFQLVEKVDLTFDPAPVVNMTVTTTEGEADPVEATAEQLEAGKIEQLEPGTEVKLKAKKGYKFIKVEAKEEK